MRKVVVVVVRIPVARVNCERTRDDRKIVLEDLKT